MGSSFEKNITNGSFFDTYDIWVKEMVIAEENRIKEKMEPVEKHIRTHIEDFLECKTAKDIKELARLVVEASERLERTQRQEAATFMGVQLPASNPMSSLFMFRDWIYVIE